MLDSIALRFPFSRWRHLLITLFVTVGVILAAVFLGARASSRILILLVLVPAAAVLLSKPVLGLLLLVPASLFTTMQFSTGTAVRVNPATLLVPALVALLVLDMMRKRKVLVAPARVSRPLFLFLVAGLLSLALGQALWDPAVPRPDNFAIVQVAQWSVFAFSAGAFWLSGNLIRELAWLRRLTFLFLALAGGLVFLLELPPTGVFANQIATQALHRAPFWSLLAGLAGGQVLFNKDLTRGWRALFFAILVAVAVYAFSLMRSTASNWVGVTTVVGVLAWLRWPRLRWPMVAAVVVLLGSGFLSSAVYDFAGGQNEWLRSGGSRLVLIDRVIEVTMRNPVTGLGPAAYRLYTSVEPLQYGRALWLTPEVNSHNNYVDLFSQVGLLGLALFGWFAAEVARLGLSLRSRFTEDFAAGYINGMLATGVGALVLMMLADWILPFVYNIGFDGFQASVLVWMFLGGLLALQKISDSEEAS